MTKVIDFGKKKREKEVKAVNVGRLPTWTGGRAIPNPPSVHDDFEARMVRIRASLEKINYLMLELNKNHKKDDR